MKLVPPNTENFSVAAAVRKFSNTSNSNNRSNSNLGRSRDNLHCNYCNKDRHTIETCHKLHGYPTGHPRHRDHSGTNRSGSSSSITGERNHNSGWKGPTSSFANQVSQPSHQDSINHQHKDQSGQTFHTDSAHNFQNILAGLSDEQCKQLTAAMVNFSKSTSANSNSFENTTGPSFPLSINSMFSNSWILDSGATDHVTYDSSSFIHTNMSSIPTINLPTGSSVPIDSTGTILFNKDIRLDNVLHVPSFRLNLMSASKVTKSLHCCIILFPDFCVIQDLASGQMIGWGLYFMSPVHHNSVTCHATISTHTWHQWRIQDFDLMGSRCKNVDFFFKQK